MKQQPTSLKNSILPALAIAAVGMLGVDTLYRLFVKRPAAGAAETTVSLALGKARPWSEAEQQVLARLLPPCRQPAIEGKLKETVECWYREAQQAHTQADQDGQNDEAVLTALLDRAGYKR